MCSLGSTEKKKKKKIRKSTTSPQLASNLPERIMGAQRIKSVQKCVYVYKLKEKSDRDTKYSQMLLNAFGSKWICGLMPDSGGDLN